MGLAIYTVIVFVGAGYLGYRVGSRVKAEVYKYYDAVSKLAAADYAVVTSLLRKVREDI